MIKIEQRFADDCLSACLASLLELPIEDVPVFSRNADSWQLDLELWLKQFGLKPLLLQADAAAFLTGPQLVCGRSPRQESGHCVIFENGELLWDPHPSDKRGATPLDYVVVFVPTDAAKAAAAHKQSTRGN